jgi:Xaa-Pro aminopeptidase
MNKIDEFIKRFSAGINGIKSDAALIISQNNRKYLTNLETTSGYVLVTAQKAYCIVDFRYSEMAKKVVKGFEIVEFSNINNTIKEIIEKDNLKSIMLEGEGISFKQAKQLIEQFKSYGVDAICDDSLDNLLWGMRNVKSEDEIENIIKAQKITDDALSHILPLIKPGLTDKEIAVELEYFMKKKGAERMAFDMIVVSGANSSLPHGIPTDKIIENGDFLTIDMGCVVNGYNSDMTRTVAVGHATDEMKKVYDIVLKAQKAAIDYIKAGVLTCDVDKVARDIIYNSGYEGYFGHGTGHCLGIDIHESPRCAPSFKVKMRAGMVTSVEPGIYLPGKFGVRIEDIVVVTDNGTRNLTKSPKELIII